MPATPGPTMDPKVASELSLRMPTLALRMQEHSARAQVRRPASQRPPAAAIRCRCTS